MTEARQKQVPLPPSCLKTRQYVIAGEETVIQSQSQQLSRPCLPSSSPESTRGQEWSVPFFKGLFIYLFACLLQKPFVFIIEDWGDTKSMKNERKNHSFSQPDMTAGNTWRDGQPQMLV